MKTIQGTGTPSTFADVGAGDRCKLDRPETNCLVRDRLETPAEKEDREEEEAGGHIGVDKRRRKRWMKNNKVVRTSASTDNEKDHGHALTHKTGRALVVSEVHVRAEAGVE